MNSYNFSIQYNAPYTINPKCPPAIPSELAARMQDIKSYMGNGKIAEGMTLLEQTKKEYKENPHVIKLEALLTEENGDLKAALELMHKALAISPEWGEALTELARMLARNYEIKLAYETIQKASRYIKEESPSFLIVGYKISREIGKFESERCFLEALHKIRPTKENKKELASCHERLGEHQAAKDIYYEILNNDPKDEVALAFRMKEHIREGKHESALDDCNLLLKINSESGIYKTYNKILLGKNPDHIDNTITRSLFDNYAEFFDDHLVNLLKYDAPVKAADYLVDIFKGQNFSILDLGCGTGLFGKAVKSNKNKITGIDLSERMLTKAAELNIYDLLINEDITCFLESTQEYSFDAVVALDVFIYIGEIADVLKHSYRIISKNGVLIFTCETADENGSNLILDPLTLRYKHKRSHIKGICIQCGFSIIEIKDETLRNDGGRPVSGFTLIARKPA